MHIGYIRMSGPIGLSPQDEGTRGLWWEKRIALLNFFWQRGHSVQLLGKATEPTKIEFKNFFTDEVNQNFDLLCIEFGSSNMQFYGDQIRKVFEIANNFKGRKVFICDDPDLPCPWDLVTNPNEWALWYNARNGLKLSKDPAAAQWYDMPFSSLQKHITIKDEEPIGSDLVYIGRPNGREKDIKLMMAVGVDFKVYGRQKEWDHLGKRVHEAPQQTQRARFYHRQLGCLVFADKKHEELGWRTGRAYHALLAGCPAICKISHSGLNKVFHTFSTPAEIALFKKVLPLERREILQEQRKKMAELDQPSVDKIIADFSL